jgi:hypothetical protein
MSASQTGPAGPELPTRTALAHATAHTAAVLKDPGASLQDIHHAAELEAATLHAFWHRPGNQAKAELEREPEAAA